MEDTSQRGFSRDQIRQVLNLVLVASPVVVSVAGEITGSNQSFSESDATTPAIVPADYAFIIWTLIYGSSMAYALYQAQPRQRENPLLRQVGFPTAFAFLGTTLWLLAAQRGWFGLTVLCMVGILASLVAAFAPLIRAHAPRSPTERYLVVMPISVFLGWITVATVANAATFLQGIGFRDVGLSEQQWSIVMLVLAGLIASYVVLASRGNVWYALTVIWGLVGVVVANVERSPNPLIAAVAGSVATALAFVLLHTQRSPLLGSATRRA